MFTYVNLWKTLISAAGSTSVVMLILTCGPAPRTQFRVMLPENSSIPAVYLNGKPPCADEPFEVPYTPRREYICSNSIVTLIAGDSTIVKLDMEMNDINVTRTLNLSFRVSPSRLDSFAVSYHKTLQHDKWTVYSNWRSRTNGRYCYEYARRDTYTMYLCIYPSNEGDTTINALFTTSVPSN